MRPSEALPSRHEVLPSTRFEGSDQLSSSVHGSESVDAARAVRQQMVLDVRRRSSELMRPGPAGRHHASFSGTSRESAPRPSSASCYSAEASLRRRRELLDNLIALQAAAEEPTSSRHDVAITTPQDSVAATVAALDPRDLAVLRSYETRLKSGLEDVCTICLEARRQGQAVLGLPCGHVFHAQCVRRWLACSACCPACRRTVSAAARW